MLLTRGANPYLTLLAAVAVGALAGLATGLIHVCLKVRDLLAGIITTTALFSLNLQIAGSNLTVERAVETIFTAPPTMALFGGMSLLYRKLIVSFLLVLLLKLLLDLYFKTKNGLLLRAVGDNETLVTTLAKNKGTVKILGLVIANALVALSGCVVCQEQRSFSATMGTGRWYSVSRPSSSARPSFANCPLSKGRPRWSPAAFYTKDAFSWRFWRGFRPTCSS